MLTPMTMFHQARRPNGQMAVIAATPTTIYRYYGLDNGPYFSESASDYPAMQTPLYVSENPSDYPAGEVPEYVSDLQGEWIIIGSGFSPDAQRWEALNINGWAVFNNGVDLPVTYRVEETSVVPIYELREHGIASVGCISELNGALKCGDIRELKPDALTALFMGGGNHYAAITDESLINHISYRVINSVPNFPRRWGSTFPGSITAGSNTLTLKYAVSSLAYGMHVNVIGAGVDGGNLQTEILNISGAHAVLLDTAQTTVTDALIEALQDDGSLATAGLVGSYDLQDDSSGIVKMASLKRALVVFKDTSVFLGTYTGKQGALFSYERIVPHTSASVYYRNTLISIKDQFLLYAGRNAFYSFDLTNQRPQELPIMEALSNLFYDQVGVEDTAGIFTAENAITKEVWIVFPSVTDDQAICYDYFTNTCSTTSMEITAGLTIKKPTAGLASGPQEDWFIMGLTDGSVAQYGLTSAKPVPSGSITASQSGNTVTASSPIFESCHVNRSVQFANRMVVNILSVTSPTVVQVGGLAQTVAAQKFTVIPEVFARANAAYTSVLQGGLSPWGEPYREKDIESYVLTLSSFSPDCSILFEMLGVRNTAEDVDLLGSKTITSPKTANLVSMYYRRNYLQDRITISGLNDPCQLLSRTFKIATVVSESFVRHP